MKFLDVSISMFVDFCDKNHSFDNVGRDAEPFCYPGSSILAPGSMMAYSPSLTICSTPVPCFFGVFDGYIIARFCEEVKCFYSLWRVFVDVAVSSSFVLLISLCL